MTLFESEIQQYLDAMTQFAGSEVAPAYYSQEALFAQDDVMEAQALNVCSLDETDFERYKRWKALDEEARLGQAEDMDRVMPAMFAVVDLNGDGVLDRCELAKECYGAWGLSKQECIQMAQEQYPMEREDIGHIMFRKQELGI